MAATTGFGLVECLRGDIITLAARQGVLGANALGGHRLVGEPKGVEGIGVITQDLDAFT